MSFSDDDKELRNWMEAKNHQSVNLKQVALLEVPALQKQKSTKLAFSQYLAHKISFLGQLLSSW